MTMEEGLFAFLSTDPVLSEQLGARYYPVVVPEGTPLTFPICTYRRAGRTKDRDLDGAGIETVTIELTTWHIEYDNVKMPALAVEQTLDGYSGRLGDVLALALLENEEDTFNEEPPLYGVIQTYRFTIENS